MRLSSSLQDFSKSTRAGLGTGDFDIELNNSYINNKHIRSLQREGAASSFSKEKSLPTSPSTRKKWARKVLLGLVGLLLLVALFYMSSRYFNGSLSRQTSDYLVILDCGSTGTRAFVYELSVQSSDHGGLPFVLRSLPADPKNMSTARTGRAYQRMETEPGFSKLVHNESGLKAAINPLLKWAEEQIPKHAYKRTSLFLYATAGVRRLPDSDSEWLMETAWSILKKSSFYCERKWVKIIAGMEEAYYGWIALNYHMGLFGSSLAKDTYGALDLGGSSLQVTFETKNRIYDATTVDLSIGEVSHHLSAYSLPGYGLNDAFDKSVAYLLKSQRLASLNNDKLELRHPCLQMGYREEYICSHCGLLDQNGSPLSGGKTTSKGKQGVPIELIGASHWDDCSALAKATVNLSEWLNKSSGVDCELRPCALAENLPVPRGQFYAMSGFFVVYRFFNLSSDASLDDVLQIGHDFCEKEWEVAKNSVVPQPFIEQYCFRAPYIVSLLRDGLHIIDNQVFIGSGSITWTLGVALLEAGQALSRKSEFHAFDIFHAGTKPMVLLIFLLFSVMLLFCAISYAFNWVPKNFRRPYLPLYRNNSTSPSILNFQLWSPTGDGRVKTPLSPTIADSMQRPFGVGGSNVQLADLSQPLGFAHSVSSGSLGQFGNGIGSSFMTPIRGQTLQSRRSQSREDLMSSLTEAHIPIPKV